MCRKVDAQRLVCVRYIHRTPLLARDTRAEAYTGRGEARTDKPPASRGSAPYCIFDFRFVNLSFEITETVGRDQHRLRMSDEVPRGTRGRQPIACGAGQTVAQHVARRTRTGRVHPSTDDPILSYVSIRRAAQIPISPRPHRSTSRSGPHGGPMALAHACS